MRADNSRHVIAAARRRAEQTRERAIAALRRMDATGQRITFDTVSRAAGVSRSWLYAQQDLRAEIHRLRQRHPATSPPQVPPSGSAHRIPRCCAASRRPPPASVAWKQTTSNSATPSPGPSANAGPSKCSARRTAATRRRRTRRKSSGRAERRLMPPRQGHVHIASPQVKAMIEGRAQDKSRKRHIAVDVIGLLLTVLVTAASVQDRDAARPLLWNLRKAFPKIRLAWADGIYAGQLIPWAKTALKLTVQIVRRPDDLHTFQVLPRRWVVERTLAWITRHRRTVRDYERLTEHHETIIYWAMIITMSRRLARQRQAFQPLPRPG
jgi:transposase